MMIAAGFEYWWHAMGEPVEPPNVRRNGKSGVERLTTENGVLYIKRQHDHLFYSLRYPAGYPTAMRESHAIKLIGRIGVRVPEVVFAEAHHIDGQWRAVLVTRNLEGYQDLAQWYAGGGRERLGMEQHRSFLHKLGSVLGLLHRYHWQHTCLYPKHIFVTPGDDGHLPDIALLDLEKARRRLLPGKAAKRDLAQLKRHAKMWDDEDWKSLLAGHAAAAL